MLIYFCKYLEATLYIHMKAFTAFLSQKYFIKAEKKNVRSLDEYVEQHIRQNQLSFNYGQKNEVGI